MKTLSNGVATGKDSNIPNRLLYIVFSTKLKKSITPITLSGERDNYPNRKHRPSPIVSQIKRSAGRGSADGLKGILNLRSQLDRAAGRGYTHVCMH